MTRECKAEPETDVSGPISGWVKLSCSEYPEKDLTQSTSGFTYHQAIRNAEEAGQEFIQRCQELEGECLLKEICQQKFHGVYGWQPVDKNKKYPRLNFEN